MRYITQVWKRSFAVAAMIAICGFFGFGSAVQAQQIIYYDNFSGSGSDLLAGTSPTIANGIAGGSGSAQWSPNGLYWRADGTVSTGTAPGGVEGNPYTDNALLPFTPQAGKIYTLSLTVERGENNWIWMGFGTSAMADTGSDARPNTSTRGMGWMAVFNTSNDVSTWTGMGTAGQGNHIASGSEVDIAIVLDTMTDPDNWSFEWFINGNSVRGPVSFGTDIDSNEIAQVGFGRYRNASGGVSEFSFTVVPEPGSIALMGAGAALLLLRRRK